MKKLAIAVIIFIIFVALLITCAFLYIDLTGHRSYAYDIFVADKPFGSVEVDTYITEEKVIYKSKAFYWHSSGHPSAKEKLVLQKSKMLPLKYTQEVMGARGGVQQFFLKQNIDKTDFLFLSPPRYFFMKDFETGHKTMVFSPDNIMTYMPILEKYNFWKKGTQYFEVMVPLDRPVPVLRDKMEVKYVDEEYISVMGRKVETELFTVDSAGLPEARVFLSKYKHQILRLEIPKRKTVFVAVEEKEPRAEIIPGGKEIFFESKGQILSGRLWLPEGNGPFPAVILVSRDGLMTNAEHAFRESYAKDLSGAGLAVLMFDKPGQGKSQGSFSDVDDEKRLRNIRDAVAYLKSLKEIKGDKIILIGYKEGGYLSLKAAKEMPDLHSCVVLAMPFESIKAEGFDSAAQAMIAGALKENKYGQFEEEYIKRVTEKLRDFLEKVAASTDEPAFFMGARVPLKGYREYIFRDPQGAVLSFDKPLFMVFGGKDPSFNAQTAENLKKAAQKAGMQDINITVIGNLNSYMGKNSEADGLLDFDVNEEVLQLIKNWARKEKAPPPEPPAPPPAEEVKGETVTLNK